MKKWLMLALFPLLLAQQKADATMWVSSGNVGSSHYDATFYVNDPDTCKDFLGTTTAYNICLAIQFTNTDLNAVYQAYNGDDLDTIVLEDNSLIEFKIASQQYVVSLLIVGGEVWDYFNSILKPPVIDVAAGTITGGGCVPGDQNCGWLDFIDSSTVTIEISTGTSENPITPPAIPVPTSLLLMGIGLAAMGVWLRRNQLA